MSEKNFLRKSASNPDLRAIHRSQLRRSPSDNSLLNQYRQQANITSPGRFPRVDYSANAIPANEEQSHTSTSLNQSESSIYTAEVAQPGDPLLRSTARSGNLDIIAPREPDSEAHNERIRQSTIIDNLLQQSLSREERRAMQHLVNILIANGSDGSSDGSYTSSNVSYESSYLSDGSSSISVATDQAQQNSGSIQQMMETLRRGPQRIQEYIGQQWASLWTNTDQVSSNQNSLSMSSEISEGSSQTTDTADQPQPMLMGVVLERLQQQREYLQQQLQNLNPSIEQQQQMQRTLQAIEALQQNPQRIEDILGDIRRRQLSQGSSEEQNSSS